MIDTGNALADTPFNLAVVENEIVQGDLDTISPVSIVLTDAEKTANRNTWRSYREIYHGHNLFPRIGAVSPMRLSSDRRTPSDRSRTSYGHDISNELQNKLTVVFPEPEYDPAILTRHGDRETMVRDGQANLRAARDL